MLRWLAALLAVCSYWTSADPACVMSPSGKMLCCAAKDLECIKKVQSAHPEPTPEPPVVPETPRFHSSFAHLNTFANASVWDRTSVFDVAVVGMPFGLALGYEAPGMQLVRREASRLQPYSRSYGISLTDLHFVDGQDLLAGSTDRMRELEAAALPFFQTGKPVVTLGGDQSITVPLLKAAKASVGEFAVLHIDKDLAIGNGSREQALDETTTMYWGAAVPLFDTRHSLHVASRGNLQSRRVELIDQELGFSTITVEEIATLGIAGTVQRIKERLTRRDGTYMLAYLSIDLDVLDPTFFPGSGGEPGGLSVVELRALLAGLRPFCRAVGADLRGVAGLSDPIAGRVAAAVAHDLVLLVGREPGKDLMVPPLGAGPDSEL